MILSHWLEIRSVFKHNPLRSQTKLCPKTEAVAFEDLRWPVFLDSMAVPV